MTLTRPDPDREFASAWADWKLTVIRGNRSNVEYMTDAERLKLAATAPMWAEPVPSPVYPGKRSR